MNSEIGMRNAESNSEFGIRSAECGILQPRCYASPEAPQSFRIPQSAIRNPPTSFRIPQSAIRIPPTSFRTPQSAIRIRAGVTLIELLITVTIIAILAATFVGVSSLAIESTRKARTKSTITKIHGLLMERWRDYETRSVEIDPTVVNEVEKQIAALGTPYNTYAAKVRLRGEAMADLRLLAIREMMKYEMPDRWTDIAEISPFAPTFNPVTVKIRIPRVLAQTPSLARTYYRRFQRLNTTKTNKKEVYLTNQGAECLFMIVMYGTGDGEARTLFNEQDIGDTDGDGAPEFLDGWGQPIQFIRWPAGFVTQSSLMSGDGDADHDPLDYFRRDTSTVLRSYISIYPNTIPGSPSRSVKLRTELQRMENRYVDLNGENSVDGKYLSAFRMVPLVYSVGSDGVPDIMDSQPAEVSLDPYIDNYNYNGNSTNALQLGAPWDKDNDGQGWVDNIHNQQLDAK